MVSTKIQEVLLKCVKIISLVFLSLEYGQSLVALLATNNSSCGGSKGRHRQSLIRPSFLLAREVEATSL